MKKILNCVLFAAALLAPHVPAWAQGQPGSTMSIVVPYPAGGLSDVIARNIAPMLGRLLGRTVVVENVVGASGSIGANKVLNGPADGSQLFIGSPTDVVLAPLTLKSIKYRASDFSMVGLVTTMPLALYARGDFPANTIDEAVALARKAGARDLTYGSTGPGSLYHIVGDRLVKTAGMGAIHVPYKGGMPLLQDLMGGVVDLTVLPVDGTIGGMVASGKMKVLGVAAPARAARYPNAGTFKESRALAGFDNQGVWVGVLVPAKTPAATQATLNRALAHVLGMPEVRAAIEAGAGSISPPMSPADLNTFLKADSAKLQAMAKAANVEPN